MSSTLTPITEQEMRAIFPEAYLKRCECSEGCPCEQSSGPAGVQISRKGKFMWVCTRCTLPGDTKFGIVKDKAQQDACLEYDPLFVLEMMRAEREDLISLISDLYKDRNGFRPRPDWKSMTTEELEAWADSFGGDE